MASRAVVAYNVNKFLSGFFFYYLLGLKKPCIRFSPEARLQIFLVLFFALFDFFSRLMLAQEWTILTKDVLKKVPNVFPLKYVDYSNSQSSICFVVLPRYFSFRTVRFWTVLHIFSTFSFNSIVILLSAICYISKSTNSLKCYNTYTTFQFPYSQEVVENNILLPYLGLPIK